ncbi:hypothetical protein Hanom_Chr07g00583921 [Helianthus anomalus]
MVIAFLCLCPNDVVCMLLYMIYIILCHSDQFLGMGDFLFSIFFDLVCWFVGLLFVFELRVSLEAASLSLWIEASPFNLGGVEFSGKSNPTPDMSMWYL